MFPGAVDTNWLINREMYGPEAARKMRENAWEQLWDVSGDAQSPAERNGWLIEAANGSTLYEAIASALDRFRRIGRPMPTAHQP